MAASTAVRDEVVLGVALFYLSAAISHLEDEHGFSLPRSRRLSGHWIRRLQNSGRSAPLLAWPPSGRPAPADPALAVTPMANADVAQAATHLLVSAFRERCARRSGEESTHDALLDRIVVLALERAHETCAALESHDREGERHGLEQHTS